MPTGERAVSFRVTRRMANDGTPLSADTPTVDTGTVAVWFWCPGCEEAHCVNVGGTEPGPKWAWNGSLDRPTFSPSLLVWHGDEAKPTKRCHSFVVDGRIQFLGDCSHQLANSTVDIPQPPEWLRS